MLKRIGLVAAATIGLSLVATPAFASPTADDQAPSAGSARIVDPYLVGAQPTFGDAFNAFVDGGSALGYGAAAVVAGAYTGIALTPALIATSFSCQSGACG